MKTDTYKIVECKLCGNNWETKIDPKQCPKCKRYDWNEKKEVK